MLIRLQPDKHGTTLMVASIERDVTGFYSMGAVIGIRKGKTYLRK